MLTYCKRVGMTLRVAPKASFRGGNTGAISPMSPLLRFTCQMSVPLAVKFDIFVGIVTFLLGNQHLQNF